MSKISVYNLEAKKVKDIKLNPEIFGVDVKESVVHQVAVAQMNNARVATAHTKTRGEVRGGGAKPWRQKGTGRARHGSSRSPLWVGGGVTFGPRSDRNYSQKVNKKMKTKALLMCLSDKVNNSILTVLDKVELKEGKTKEIVKVIKDFKDILSLKHLSTKTLKHTKKQEKGDKKDNNKTMKQSNNGSFDIKDYKLSLLIVLAKSDKKVFNAGRNLTGLKITTAGSLNVGDLLRYKNILITEESLKEIENIFLKNK